MLPVLSSTLIDTSWLDRATNDIVSFVLAIVSVIFALLFVYLIRIHIAYRMAKNRHRDPLGWVLLSLFVSPVLTWIILLIAGNASSAQNA